MIHFILNSNLAEIMASTNRKLIIPLQKIVSHFQSSPNSLITSPIINYFSAEDKRKSDDHNAQLQNKILE
jgi:hypothetical protein